MEEPPEASSVAIYKVALCGSKNVGKSSIFLRIRDGKFDPTIAAKRCDMNQECLIPQIEDDREFKIQLWDTLGFEEYATLSRSHYKDSHVILVVYSADVQNSLVEAQSFLLVAKGHAPGAKMILVRNKIDLDPKESEHGDVNVGSGYHMSTEISAKTGEGTDEMLHMIYQKFLCHATPLKRRRSRNLSLVSSTTPSEQSDNLSGNSVPVAGFNIAEDEQSPSQRKWCSC